MIRLKEHEPTGYIDCTGKEICEGHLIYCTPSDYLCPLIVEIFWVDDEENWGKDWMFCEDFGPLTWDEIKDGNPRIVGKDSILFCPYCENLDNYLDENIGNGSFVTCKVCNARGPSLDPIKFKSKEINIGNKEWSENIAVTLWNSLERDFIKGNKLGRDIINIK